MWILTVFHFFSSAIRAELVPWGRMEGQGQGVCEAIGRNGGHSSSVREGSDGESTIRLRGLYSLCPFLRFSWGMGERNSCGGRAPLVPYRRISMEIFTDAHCRPLEQPSLRTCLNCLTARRSLQPSSTTLSGRLLRYTQVRPTTL